MSTHAHEATRDRVGSLTKVDVGLAGASAADPGGSSDGAALLERDELVEVVEIGEHLSENDNQRSDHSPQSKQHPHTARKHCCQPSQQSSGNVDCVRYEAMI